MVNLKTLSKKSEQLPIGKKWDKLRSWHVLKDDIEEKLKEPEKFDTGITLEIGPQLLHTLRHRSNLRCINHSVSKLGEVFTTHYNKGAVQRISVWVLESKTRDGVCSQQGFETQYELICLTYVAKRRVYVAFSTDLYLRIFTDANSNVTETFEVPFTSTVLCLVYNREDDEIYAGGVGFLEEWKITGAEHAASLVPGRKFLTTDINRNDWIRDVKLDRINNQLFAMHGNGILVFNLKTRKQTHRLPNRHEGPLKCCCYFPQFDYLITGGADGKIKIFNATTFNMIHILIGHYGPVTSVEPHRKETLLFSCSHDGTVRLWRMDSLRIFTRLEIGEKIYHLSLLGDSEFFFQTEKDLMIYTQNQFYQFFASVESESYKLLCCRGKGKHNRILVSTEDGSVRLFSPVTGLTLTIVYPMPSFQIFTQFAYDIHQDRLYTVLQGGKVLVYNTSTNPCKCAEMWLPSCKDEQVTNILLVTVEFTCDGVTDVDNLVFAGLNNGQIILCEALVCSLKFPVQAHEGALTCFEACSPAVDEVVKLRSSSSTIVSGGKDCYIKIWVIHICNKARRPLVELNMLLKIYLPSVPTHLCMYGDTVTVAIKTHTHVGWRWRLVMYILSSASVRRSKLSRGVGSSGNWRTSSGGWIVPFQVTHPPDEDHVLELTSLDKCPFINAFLTSGKDGFVKIWNKDNQLMREMNFSTPIYASCFANNRGDVLVGFGTHVCSVSVINYLPLENLTKLYNSTLLNFTDDGREFPVKFDHTAQPWLDLEKVRKYPIEILERRKQKIEEEVIEKLKKASEEGAEKFVIFVDGGTTQVIRKDFADRLLNWAKGKTKFRLGFKAAKPQSPTTTEHTQEAEDENVKKKKSKPIYLGQRGEAESTVEKQPETVEPKYLDSEKLIEIYPPAVGEALRDLETKKKLSPLEMRLLDEKKLLERDPIIAPDGYIPNSVIRRKLKPPKREAPIRIERRWKVKPVPKVDPKFMPVGWDIVEREREKSPPPRLVVMRWEDTPSPATSSKSRISSVSSVSLKPPTPPKLLKKFVRECHAKPKSESKSAGSTPEGARRAGDSKSRVNTQLSKASTVTLTPFVENKAPDKKKYAREDSVGASDRVLQWTPSPKPGSAVEEREESPTVDESHYDFESGGLGYQIKSKRLDMLRKEELRMKRKSGADKLKLGMPVEGKPPEAKETKTRKTIMEMELVQQLMAEKWMPKIDSSEDEYEDILTKLITKLDDSNPMVYTSVIDYLAALFKELGIQDELLDEAIAKMGANLNSLNTAIKRHTLRGLQLVGAGRKDVLQLILPKLIDGDEPVRKAAAEAILILTGAKDKETLLNLLDSYGMTGGVYSSKEDEEFALKVLAERLAEGAEDPAYFDRLQERIMDWVEMTTPGMISDDMNPEDLEQLWKEGTRSRKSSMFKSREQSFMSEKSAVETSGMTMYADLPTTPGFSSELSELCLSRGVSNAKSVDMKSAKSRYNARMGLMDLMDRSGAIHVPGERWEPPTPVTRSESSEHDPTPSIDDPLLQLQMEKSNLTNLTNESHGSKQSFDTIKVTERTLTNLSQVGPLPSFMPRGNSDGKSYDAISTDSAIESGFSASEYEGLSHYSEMLTFSHTDQQSFKDSVLSETNEVFDAEHDSEVEVEDDDKVQDELKDEDDSTEKVWGLYFEDNLEKIIEVVEEVIITPLPVLEGILEVNDDDNEDELDDKTSSKEVTPRSRVSRKSDRRRSDSRSTEPRSTPRQKVRERDDRSVASERSTSSRGSKTSSRTPTVDQNQTRDREVTTRTPLVDQNLTRNREDTTSEMSDHQEEIEEERKSSVMVIITPRGEIVKSVISIDGHTVTPRDVVQDTLVEEESDVSSPLHHYHTPPLKMSSFVDKGTHVTEKSFSSQHAIRYASPRENVPCSSGLTLQQGNQPDHARPHPTPVDFELSENKIPSHTNEMHINPDILEDILNDLDRDSNTIHEKLSSDSSGDSLDMRADLPNNSLELVSGSANKSPVTKIEITSSRSTIERDKNHSSEHSVYSDLVKTRPTGLLTSDVEVDPTDYDALSTAIDEAQESEIDMIDNDDDTLRDKSANKELINHEPDLATQLDDLFQDQKDTKFDDLLQDQKDPKLDGLFPNQKNTKSDGLLSNQKETEVIKSLLESQIPEAEVNSSSALLLTDLHDLEKPDQTIPGMVKRDLLQNSDGASNESRFTPRDSSLHRVYDRERRAPPGFQEKDEMIPVEDSDYKTMSLKASSQIMERLSGQDSGISRDMSEFSQRGKVYPYGASLSPVKSEGSVTSDKQHPKDWRKFFELPTAIERHQMELIKQEMAQGKLKHTTLPPISYFGRDLPMLPGEAGTRLLQTVRVGEKVPTSGEARHRIESVPGKLAVHTQNESEGLSCFGIIQMEWTTGVPTTRDTTYPPQRIPQHRLLNEDRYLPSLQSQLSHLDRIRQGTSDAELHLPNLATASPTVVSHRLSPSFEWELPLPPPPAKESRTIIPYIKKEHDTYCKYYQLVKKKLHLYTSPLGFIPALIAAEKARPKPKKQREKSLSLPTVVAKSMTEKQTSESSHIKQSKESSKLVLGSENFLPPIKLGQLINI